MTAPIPQLAGARHELILAELRSAGTVRVRSLADALGVSSMTVRRDLDVLAGQGLLTKVHGGATMPSTDAHQRSSAEPSFEAKALHQRGEKVAIAALAAQMVRPGEAIGLTAGTTTARVAQHLASIRDLIIVTNSLRVLEVLQAAPDLNRTVIVTGGMPTPSAALVGPIAEQALENLHLDRVFMGVHGMNLRTGFTTPNLNEATTNQAFIAAAEQLTVVADATKWGTVGLSTIAPLNRADVLVCDSSLDASARSALESRVSDLAIAETEAGEAA